MKMFHLIGYGERAGSDVPDIYATWDNAGFADLIVDEQFGNGQPNRTIVTMPLVEKNQVVSDNIAFHFALLLSYGSVSTEIHV